MRPSVGEIGDSQLLRPGARIHGLGGVVSEGVSNEEGTPPRKPPNRGGGVMICGARGSRGSPDENQPGDVQVHPSISFHGFQ